ncbi:MAG: EF-P lysine aminoacylase EpmA [Lysobacterales bacterium]
MTLPGLMRQRAQLNSCLREFFAARGVLEVCTPVLSQAGNSDPNIDSFSTTYHGPMRGGRATRWLRTSPEFFHKRLLAAGCGDLFEIAPVFRDGECGSRHNPEFTLLEWYRVGFDHHQLMDEVESLLRALAAAFGRHLGAAERLSYQQCYQRYTGIDPLAASREELLQALAGCSIDPEGLSRDDLLDLLRTHLIEAQWSDQQFLFIHDFPASQAALARIHAGDPRVAERFELYLGRVELANGYHELNDAAEQRQRFERDLAERKRRGAVLPALDELLLQALPQMPDCAGVALGVERLHQWLVGADSIEAVMPFGFAQA